MVNPNLLRSWARTRKLLEAASALLPPSLAAQLAKYEEFVDHNELELAMDELDAIGDEIRASADFYLLLSLAAANMQLSHREIQLRNKAQPAQS